MMRPLPCRSFSSEILADHAGQDRAAPTDWPPSLRGSLSDRRNRPFWKSGLSPLEGGSRGVFFARPQATAAISRVRIPPSTAQQNVGQGPPYEQADPTGWDRAAGAAKSSPAAPWSAGAMLQPFFREAMLPGSAEQDFAKTRRKHPPSPSFGGTSPVQGAHWLVHRGMCKAPCGNTTFGCNSGWVCSAPFRTFPSS